MLATFDRGRAVAISHAARINGGRFNAGRMRVGQHVHNCGRRHDNDCMLHRPGRIAQAWISWLAVDFDLFWIDEIERPFEPKLAAGHINVARPASALGRPHQRHRTRAQYGFRRPEFYQAFAQATPPHRLARFFQTRSFIEFDGVASSRQSSCWLAMRQMKARPRLPGHLRRGVACKSDLQEPAQLLVFCK